MYSDPIQFEPLRIVESRPAYRELIGIAHEFITESAALESLVPAASRRGLADLVVGMNCYYSNLIEGHHTLPRDIDRALHASTKGVTNQRSLQKLASAHIAASRWAQSQDLDAAGLPAFIQGVHRQFCAALPEDMLRLQDGAVMQPGQWREAEVEVGQHVAPAKASLTRFIDRFTQVYGPLLVSARKGGIQQLDAVVAIMASHHRFLWIHPFADGNGRVARILLDAMLRQAGINASGLWSMSRGFARVTDPRAATQPRGTLPYKGYLAAADESRMGDLDGRGSLSEKRLVDFCSYALMTAKDQVRFMSRLFELGSLEKRCHHYFGNVRLDLKPQAAYLYLHALRQGKFDRGEAPRLTGLKERTARDLLAMLVSEGFLASDSPKGKVRAEFPFHALGSLFPNLFPAGTTDLAVPAIEDDEGEEGAEKPSAA